MVNSIRYWLIASQMAEPDQSGRMKKTDFGQWILSELDPFIEDEATLWLIHWLIASNPDISTGWYWFFNHYHKTEFTNKELGEALYDFHKNNIGKKSG